ncbi:hypothetical protein Pst134EA_000147 [Puccinia striiformis f. sp. tritici]|uniref:hypothetical protein n=1 Tax=Puccinia striiformis f. sp. tritici TaxID=168172 RepID=UPI002007F024|nr:hypothetical protein Pst134EA_000147 [Puccinia striiformis f. sp. tritici]KAH9473068.1 hypothetical protein Pst134EA_000147 [Puccinia striiformis f. sp. tritici]
MVRISCSLSFNLSLMVIVSLMMVDVLSHCDHCIRMSKRVDWLTKCHYTGGDGICTRDVMHYKYVCKNCKGQILPMSMVYCDEHTSPVNPRFFTDREKAKARKFKEKVEKKEKAVRTQQKTIVSSVHLCC